MSLELVQQAQAEMDALDDRRDRIVRGRRLAEDVAVGRVETDNKNFIDAVRCLLGLDPLEYARHATETDKKCCVCGGPSGTQMTCGSRCRSTYYRSADYLEKRRAV